jgi:hypothetical protein
VAWSGIIPITPLALVVDNSAGAVGIFQISPTRIEHQVIVIDLMGNLTFGDRFLATPPRHPDGPIEGLVRGVRLDASITFSILIGTRPTIDSNWTLNTYSLDSLKIVGSSSIKADNELLVSTKFLDTAERIASRALPPQMFKSLEMLRIPSEIIGREVYDARLIHDNRIALLPAPGNRLMILDLNTRETVTMDLTASNGNLQYVRCDIIPESQRIALQMKRTREEIQYPALQNIFKLLEVDVRTGEMLPKMIGCKNRVIPERLEWRLLSTAPRCSLAYSGSRVFMFSPDGYLKWEHNRLSDGRWLRGIHSVLDLTSGNLCIINEAESNAGNFETCLTIVNSIRPDLNSKSWVVDSELGRTLGSSSYEDFVFICGPRYLYRVNSRNGRAERLDFGSGVLGRKIVAMSSSRVVCFDSASTAHVIGFPAD